ncbi:MAG: 50S ribosomal protein L18 [Rickettsiales bacterium]|nr:50S ribosomal protein L18 [Rickettsiales bacterium]
MSRHNRAFKNRQDRIRSKLKKRNYGLPRLTVFKSNSYIYTQVIDDGKGETLVSANTLQKEFKGLKNKYNMEAAKAVGQKLAEVMLKKGLKKAVFDKGGYKYHGKVKAIADSVREAGVVV